MKKIVLTLLLGSLFLAGSALAAVDCRSISACRAAGNAPAIHFTVVGDPEQDVRVDADVYGGSDCAAEDFQSVGDDLVLNPGPNNVFLVFNPPLSGTTRLSVAWQVADCPLRCDNYTPIGQTPACAPGTTTPLNEFDELEEPDQDQP